MLFSLKIWFENIYLRIVSAVDDNAEMIRNVNSSDQINVDLVASSPRRNNLYIMGPQLLVCDNSTKIKKSIKSKMLKFVIIVAVCIIASVLIPNGFFAGDHLHGFDRR